MATLVDLLTNVINLSSNVNSLKADVARMNQMLLDLNERIVRLEGAGELNAEKARNAALGACNQSTIELMKQMHTLTTRLDAIEAPKTRLPAEFRLPHGDGAAVETGRS